jgi:hypothetical protein
MRRAERAARRQERAARYGGAWIGGVVLILLGVVFLLQNTGTRLPENWWAFFILIPAGGAFTAAWNSYQRAGGQLDAAARGSLIGGLVLTMVAVTFLLNLNWGILWPVLLIIAGVGALLNALLPGSSDGQDG